MVDRRFFSYGGPFSLSKIAEMTGAVLRNCADPTQEISNVAALDSATIGDISFL